MPYALIRAPEFKDWFKKESNKSKIQIDDRLARIEVDEYFGDHKSLQDNLFELRWVNGRRVYYVYLQGKTVLLLLGGTKNDQKKDINKARKILKKYT